MRVLVSIAFLALAGCASGRLYVDGGLSYSDARIARDEPGAVAVRGFDGTVVGTLGLAQQVARNESPYALIAVGYEAQLSKRCIAAAEISHTSSIATGRDRGFNFVTVFVRWHPFN
jgi:hypothetical protein